MTSGPRHRADLQQLYRAAIRRHAEQPQGFREPIEATHRYEEYNPLCGDRIEIALRLNPERIIAAAAFDGEACAICMASASLLCSLAPGRSDAAVRRLHDGLQQALRPADSTPPAGDRSSPTDAAAQLPEELQPLLGVRPYPSRVRCATLPWTAAIRALDHCTG